MGRFIDLPKIAHPDFAVPGQNPVGPVEIDWSHPLAQGLSLAITAQHGVLHGSLSIELQGSFTRFPYRGEMVWGHNSSTTTRTDYLDITGSAIPDTSAPYTVLFRAARAQPIVGSTVAGLIDMSSTSNGNEINYGNGFGAAADDHKPRHSTNSGTPDIFISGQDPSGHNPAAYTIETGRFYNILSLHTYNAAANRWSINRGSTASFTVPVYVSVHYAWSRRLSDAEALSITRDPYQIIKPATTLQFYVPSAGGSPTLELNDSNNNQVSDSVSLSVVSLLSLNNSTQLQNSESISLFENYNLIVSESNQLQNSDFLNLTQNNILSLSDTNQIDSSESISLLQNYFLQISDSSQNNNSEIVNLIQNNLLSVFNSIQSSESNSVSLSGTILLSITDTNESQNSESVSLSQNLQLLISDSLQENNSESVTIVENNFVQVTDTNNAQISDIVQIIQHNALTINNSEQEQYSEITNLSESSNLLISNSSQTQNSQIVLVDFVANLNLIDTNQSQNSEVVIIKENSFILIANGEQIQFSESVSLILYGSGLTDIASAYTVMIDDIPHSINIFDSANEVLI